jgi:hypothetical protein
MDSSEQLAMLSTFYAKIVEKDTRARATYEKRLYSSKREKRLSRDFLFMAKS